MERQRGSAGRMQPVHNIGFQSMLCRRGLPPSGLVSQLAGIMGSANGQGTGDDSAVDRALGWCGLQVCILGRHKPQFWGSLSERHARCLGGGPAGKGQEGRWAQRSRCRNRYARLLERAHGSGGWRACACACARVGSGDGADKVVFAAILTPAAQQKMQKQEARRKGTAHAIAGNTPFHFSACFCSTFSCNPGRACPITSAARRDSVRREGQSRSEGSTTTIMTGRACLSVSCACRGP
ncbi:hypothetical protein BDW02DRAFT_578316 [Decorospora gaudefroyi]|uniref:Uncharacterized protein n=1 Tax=Decorospora gaudefroyi TaxID=184978 RepID=A0A6A5KQU0_9PLEO|nr:hypothetical protein BDW02DRAFT_578316 [Decorospora gaudefroyi]